MAPYRKEPHAARKKHRYQAILALVFLPDVSTHRWEESVATFKPKSQRQGNASVELAAASSTGLFLGVLYANPVKVEPDNLAPVARRVTSDLGGNPDNARLMDVQRVGIGRMEGSRLTKVSLRRRSSLRFHVG